MVAASVVPGPDHTRHPRGFTVRSIRTVVIALCFVGLHALVGCGNGDDPPASDPTSTSAASPSGSPASSVDDTVEPATGKLVETDAFTVRLPEGFRLGASIGLAVSGYKAGARGFLAVHSIKLYEHNSLDLLARESAAGTTWDRKPRRLEDTAIDGVAAFHLRGRLAEGIPKDEYGATHDGMWGGLVFAVAVPAHERDRLVESMLASWQWK